MSGALCMVVMQMTHVAPVPAVHGGYAISYLTHATPAVVEAPVGLDDFIGDSSACEWHVYDPWRGTDRLLFRLPATPMPVRWTRDFERIWFYSQHGVWQAGWRPPSPPVVIAPAPPLGRFCDLWIDSLTSRVCVATTTERPESTRFGIGTMVTTRTWSWDGARWHETARDSSLGEGGCADVDPFRAGRSSVSLDALLDSMSIDSHAASTPVPLPRRDSTNAEYTVTVPVRCGSGRHLLVAGSTGDRDHAQEPIAWVDEARGTRHTIYPVGASRDAESGQIAFAERDCMLLVTAEYSGAFGRVIDMRDGRLIRKLPENSFAAVWAPAPR